MVRQVRGCLPDNLSSPWMLPDQLSWAETLSPQKSFSRYTPESQGSAELCQIPPASTPLIYLKPFQIFHPLVGCGKGWSHPLECRGKAQRQTLEQ